MPRGVYERKRPKCRFGQCQGFTHRFGLCNKHRKWVERGYMWKTLRMRKPVKERNNAGVECATPNCDRQVRRNGLCDRCSSRAKYVRISSRASPGSTTACKVCSDGGLIIKGFCKPHYTDFKKGFLTESGAPTGKQKMRVQSWRGVKCKVDECPTNARSRGFCPNHHDNFMSGYFDVNGTKLKDLPSKNKGMICKAEKCTKNAYARGYCHRHHYRLRKGLPVEDRDFYVNKGKMCKASGCKGPAITKEYCTKHYNRLKVGSSVNDQEFYVNKGKSCSVWGCIKPCYCKGLCGSHYYRMMKGLPEGGIPKVVKAKKRKKVSVDEGIHYVEYGFHG